MRKFKIVAKPFNRVFKYFTNVQASVEFEASAHNFMRCLEIATPHVVKLYGDEIINKLAGDGQHKDLYTFEVFELFEDGSSKLIGPFNITARVKINGIQVRVYNRHGYIENIGFMKRDRNYPR